MVAIEMEANAFWALSIPTTYLRMFLEKLVTGFFFSTTLPVSIAVLTILIISEFN